MTVSRTIREQVTSQIREDVVAGRYSTGEPLREADLAERFGVSRGPIRDAFLQLSQEGFLAYQANRGVTVRIPKAENRDLIVSLRQQIECFVIRRGLKKLRKGASAPIKASLDELKVACDGGDVAAIARRDMLFHEAILMACGGEDLLPIWKWLCSQMLLAYSRLDEHQQVYEEHLRIFQSLEDGRKQAAIAAIKANIR